MSPRPQIVERRIELPPRLVWAALVDPALVEGWLHPTARLVPASDDGEDRDDIARGSAVDGDIASDPDSVAQVIDLDEPLLLAVDSPVLGRLRFDLSEFPGGSRDASTRLTLTIFGADAAARPELVATWLTRFDQLNDLLHGHPVDWVNWDRDHRPDYEAHLEAVQASS